MRLTTGPIATQLGAATGCAWVDFDKDRDLDLFVTYEDHSDVLYRNLGAPNFTFNRVSLGELVTEASASRGCSWGDYDNDGDLDVFVVKNGRSRLYRNDGNGAFTRITAGDAVNDEADSRSSVWADADNDGFLNLLVVNPNFNQMYDGNVDNLLLRSQPNAVTLASGSHYGASWADLDNDGDLDLYVPNSSNPGALFRNNGTGHSWLAVKCIGTRSNKSAIGTRVRVKAKSFEKLDPIWQTREIAAQSGSGSQNSLVQLFGLGTATSVDSLVVEWPRSTSLVLANLAINQRLVLREQDATDFVVEESSPVSKIKAPATGGSWADVDNDGDQDLFVTTRKGQNLLFLNSGNGAFTAAGNLALTQEDLPSTASTWADVNNDGKLDVFVANYEAPSVLYLNQGNGNFAPAAGGDLPRDRARAVAASWGDFDNDGLVDLFVATERAPNLLYHNEGGGVFRRITAEEVGRESLDSRTAAWADYDNDGDLDLFVANYNEKNALYRNDGKGKLVRTQQPPFDTDSGASTGASWGDFDNDGDLDLLVANDGQPNFLYRNDAGTFEKITSGALVTDTGRATGSSWVDFDNDGDLDLYVSEFGGANRLYRNLGNGLFERSRQERITLVAGNWQGHAWADIDRDGDQDLFAANFERESLLYRSGGNLNRWLNLTLIGRTSNAAAIGAQVRLRAVVDGYPAWQMREVSAQTGAGFSGQNSLAVTFGLGRAPVIDSLLMRWPSGIVQTLTNVPVNQFLIVSEGSTTGVEQQAGLPVAFRLHPVYPNPFNPSTSIRYELAEPSHVRLIIYNLLGEAVEELLADRQPAGFYEMVWQAARHASGVYFVKIVAESESSDTVFTQTRKAILMK